MTKFVDKKVLITGAASGIGRLLATKLSSLKAHIICVDKDEEGMLKTVEEIKRHGGFAHGFKVDLCDLDSILRLKIDIHNQLGTIDILFNNAGVVFGGEFEKEKLDKHLLTYQVNVEALVAMTHIFFEDLKKSKGAHIINIASASGLIGLPYGTTYASSKWAVIGFSESLRLELLEREMANIQVTTVCPSYITTGMFQGVTAPLLIPWLSPDAIVNKIILGVEKNSPFVKEPFIVKTVDLLKGMLPLFLFTRISKLLGVSTSMVHWKGRD